MRTVLNKTAARTTFLSLFALASLVASPVLAEADANTAIADTETVIVIGQRANLQKIPGSGSTIEQEDLIRARVFTINEALRQAPGVFVREEEGLGLRPNIGIRGLSPIRSTKVLLLEDGLPLGYAPYGDNAAYYHPPVRRFARIEILKGASQVRFGPNSIGGVINYITPNAPDSFQGQAMIAGGSENYKEVDVSLGGPLLGFRTLAHLNATGSDGSRDNQDLQISDLYFKAEKDLNTHHAVSLRVSRFAEDSQITYSGLTQSEFEANPRQNAFVNDSFETQRIGGSGTWRWTLNDALELKTSAWSSYFERDWWRQSSNSGQRPSDASDPLCGGMANLSTTCGNEGRLRTYHTYGLETRLGYEAAWGEVNVRGELGIRGTKERQARLQVNADTPLGRKPGTSVNGGLREDNIRRTEAVATFASLNFDFGRLTISPGVRYEAITYERENRLVVGPPIRGSTDLTEVIPGLGATFELNDKLVAYAGWHRGFAPPRVEDIINNTTGGAVDLAAEKSDNFELGVRGALVRGFNLDVAWFRLDFDNQIVPASVAGGLGASLTSAGETLHQGIEVSVQGSLKDMGIMSENDWFFRAALTQVTDAKYVGARFSSVSGFTNVSVTGNRLPYAPRTLFNGAVGYAWGSWLEAQVDFTYVDKMFTDDLNTVASSANGQRGVIRAHGIWNATVNLHPPQWPVGFFVAVKNIEDEVYITDRARGVLPGTPRLVQVGMTAKF
jgi:Fe(3+) dicitrate transport protein